MASEAIVDAAAKLELFEGGTYPSQLRGVVAAGYHGEYRGFYPTGDGWRPKSSTYRGRTGGHHEGLDIYAPFAPQPLETPVLALADGEIVCRPGSLDPDDLGNRADLIAGGVRLSYGHLSRFEGRSRKGVKKGEIIGYAGCSGNADTQGECRECGACNVNSGHVHLSVRKGSDTVRPTLYYPLNLRFGEGYLSKSMACAAFVKDHGLEQKWEPAPPAAGRLVGSEDMNRMRANGCWQALPGSFAFLEFADTPSLQNSLSFYRHCAKRLAKANALDDPASTGDKLLKAFLLEKIADSSAKIGEVKPLNSLVKEIIKEGVVIGLAPGDPPAAVPGWLLRHLSRLAQMAWYSFGGAALDALGSNSYEGKRCALFNPKIYKQAYMEWKNGFLPECGASIGGLARLSATRTARNALHHTQINLAPPGDPSDPQPVVSVSFGAGSLMHAAISDHMKIAPKNGAKFSEEIGAAIADYLRAASAAADLLTTVHNLCHRHQILLSNEATSSTAPAQRQAVLKEVADAIQAAADAFAACPGRIMNSAVAAALVRRMTESNAALFEELAALSDGTETDDPIGPGLLMLEQVSG